MEPKLLKSLNRRFWSRVDVRSGTECWAWKGNTTVKGGYGKIGVGPSYRLATHVSMFLEHDRWPPKGAHVCHRCDNPICVNPKHLWIGDGSQNQQDSVTKRRHASSKKTHCVHGHTLADAYVDGNGKRLCRTCSKLAYQKRKEAGKADHQVRANRRKA